MINSKDLPEKQAQKAKALKAKQQKEQLETHKDKKWNQLKADDKDELLKLVAIKLGLLKE